MDVENLRATAVLAVGIAEDLAAAAGQPAAAALLDGLGVFLAAHDDLDPAESERCALLRMQRIISDEIAKREATG